MEEGDGLEKGKVSAFQWEVRWESHLADRDRIGLGLNAKEALTHYLRKIGSAMRDKRFRPNGVGGASFEEWAHGRKLMKLSKK